MIRADQAALFQQTNLGLLSIRQAELNYYVSLNIAFGTQAALIGGFTYGVFTQNQENEDEVYADLFQDIYWVISAGTIAAAVHVIITTMCIQVFGPGLALHGPVGSMAKATEGMRTEQKPVIYSFILMMILFSVQTIFSFWAVMSFYSAIGGTAIFVIAARYWYYYCERIYLRFYWEGGDGKWQNSVDTDDNPAEVDPPIPSLLMDRNTNPLHDHHATKKLSKQRFPNHSTDLNENLLPADHGDVLERRLTRNSEDRLRSVSRDSRTAAQQGHTGGGGGNKLLRGLRLPKIIYRASSRTSKDYPGRYSVDKDTHNKPVTAGAKYDVVMEGYLLKKGSYTLINKANPHKEPWERRYFVLNRKAQLFMYKTRQEYRLNPKAPVHSRPLCLEEFTIEVYNSEDPNSVRMISTDTTYLMDDNDIAAMGAPRRASTMTSPEKKIRFQITLVPKEDKEEEVTRQNWILRCDTEEELEIWVSLMRDLSPESFH